MDSYINTIVFCIKHNSKFITKDILNENNIYFSNDLFPKKNMLKSQILKILFKKISNIPNNESIITQICENNTKISFIIFTYYKSKYLINLFFGIISEELLSPLIISSDHFGVNQIIHNIFFGKPHFFTNYIRSTYNIIVNLLLNYYLLPIEIQDIIFQNCIILLNNITNAFLEIKNGNNLTQIHQYFPYLLISNILNNFSSNYWENFVKILIENNLWKILNNIDIVFEKNNLKNKEQFYNCIIQYITIIPNSYFSFQAENTITLEITGCNLENINLFENIVKTNPNSSEIINYFLLFHSKNKFNIKISGLNNYYNVPKVYS